jgi:hypothetical protein
MAEYVGQAAPAGATYMPAREKPEAVRLRPPTTDQHARELYNLPASWEAYSWSAKGERDTGFIELNGGVFNKKIERGRNKGKTDFRSPEPGTSATLSLSHAAHKAWLARWEVETGHCAECLGTGLAWAGWCSVYGTSFRPCTKCGATGSSAKAEQAA